MGRHNGSNALQLRALAADDPARAKKALAKQKALAKHIQGLR
jgi:hypothetical protein